MSSLTTPHETPANRRAWRTGKRHPRPERSSWTAWPPGPTGSAWATVSLWRARPYVWPACPRAGTLLPSFAFADKRDAEKIQRLPGSANFFLVQVEDGFDKAAVAQEIKDQVANVDVVTRQKFVANNTKLISDNFLPVILVLLVIGIAVGIAVIGLTIFTSTIEKTREYGVLKAIGMRNGALYVVVVEQALAAGVMGFALGASLALVLQATLGEVVPQFVSQIQPVDIAWIFVLTMGMAIVAAYLPMRRIAHIDPAEVFKA